MFKDSIKNRLQIKKKIKKYLKDIDKKVLFLYFYKKNKKNIKQNLFSEKKIEFL